ncbi:hypothetical protein PV08_02274 [Exophiala spinifera]|uniref:Heterokaryon incompatibility domain-containing protein n=1 Tax=Exophiala spinifera TaxID=91928 RepID=A0A0D2BGA2_9EURO|nr:uncharacterized protein PV08_02274 [Exophiala spinifera]KIW17988.1 hypothetical protein PV08_02274 [Exophiala spinifera]
MVSENRLNEDTAPVAKDSEEISLLELFVLTKQRAIESGGLNSDCSDLLDLRFIIGIAVDLGLAGWITSEAPNQGISSEPAPPSSPANQPERQTFNVDLNWVVKMRSPAELTILPTKIQHSGNYPWLGPQQTGSPNCLWDSEVSETVLATPERLQEGYIAVSYTWGRYKERYDPVDGTPWRVPIIKSDVFPGMLDQLKRILASIPASRYFWVDVLCINQDDGDQKAEEIAKQASIFGNAKACLGSLWTLDSDDELAHVMTSFGDDLLWSLVLSSSDNRRDSQLQGLERLPPHIQVRLDGKLRLDPWFTSLWALQEMVLAPAQIWMTRSGNFCSVNGLTLTTLLFARALELMNWSFQFRRQIWKLEIVRDYPLLSSDDAYRTVIRIMDRLLTEQAQAQASWEAGVTDEKRIAAEQRVRDVKVMQVMMGQDQEVRDLPELLQHKQFDEILGSKSLKRWLDWGFGEVCLNISIQASRSAIIVAGANRHTTKPRAEAILAALKITRLPPELNPDESLTPGVLPKWLQQTLMAFESSMYFYASHSWRSMSESRDRSSPLFSDNLPFLAYDNIHNDSADYVRGTLSNLLTSMLPSTATRSFLPTDFTLSSYSGYATSAWHIHRDGVMHIPYGAPIHDIRPNDTGLMTISTNGPQYEFDTTLTNGVSAVRNIDYVNEPLGKSCRVIFLPLLMIGNPTDGMPYGESRTLASTGPNPVVRGIILASRPSSKRHKSMTFWFKAGIYSATLVRINPLEWQDGILVGSVLDESRASRDKALCDITILNRPHLWGPKVRRRCFESD